MKTFIILILSCASTLSNFGADTGLRVVTATKTNAANASVYTTDIFTRDGLTNLVRVTQADASKGRAQKFYHAGVLVADYLTSKTLDVAMFQTKPGIPYFVSLSFAPSKDIRSVMIFGKDGTILDLFSCTNGVFSPVEGSRLAEAIRSAQEFEQEDERSIPKRPE